MCRVRKGSSIGSLPNFLILNTPTGSVSLCSFTSSSQKTHSHLYQLNYISSAHYSFSSKFEHRSPCSTFSNATESSPPLYRAVLFLDSSVVNSCSHGCCCSRLRYPLGPNSHSLSSPSCRRYVRAPVRSNRPRRKLRLKHLTLCS